MFKKLNFNHILALLALVCGVWATFHETPVRRAASEIAWMEKQKTETVAETELAREREKTEQLKQVAKIVKMIGQAPANFTAPLPTQNQEPVSHQRASAQDQPGVFRVPLGMRVGFSRETSFAFAGGAPSDAPRNLIHVPNPVKSITGGGEYKIVYKSSNQSTGWVRTQSSGEVPKEVKDFLGLSLKATGEPEFADLYIRDGDVMFNL